MYDPCTRTHLQPTLNRTFSQFSVCTNLLPTVSTLFIAVKNIAEQDNNLWVLDQSQQHVQHNFPTKLHQYKWHQDMYILVLNAYLCVSSSVGFSRDGRTNKVRTNGWRAGMANVVTLCPDAITPSHFWITYKSRTIIMYVIELRKSPYLGDCYKFWTVIS